MNSPSESEFDSKVPKSPLIDPNYRIRVEIIPAKMASLSTLAPHFTFGQNDRNREFFRETDFSHKQ